jgi:hypothetical protein
MALFRDFDECKKLAVLILDDFLEESHPDYQRVVERIRYEETSGRTSKAQCYMVITKIKQALWNSNIAVEIGFHAYLERKVVQKRFILEYQEANKDE